MPAISITNEDAWFTGNADIDSHIRPLVREMVQHRQQLLQTLTENRHEVGEFWLRKTRKPVLAVLLVQKPGERPRFFRGINLEVSMPTGSLCAERNVIGTALAQDPSLRRKHIKMVGVLSIPGLSAAGSAYHGGVVSQPATPSGSIPGTPVCEPASPIGNMNNFGPSMSFPAAADAASSRIKSSVHGVSSRAAPHMPGTPPIVPSASSQNNIQFSQPIPSQQQVQSPRNSSILGASGSDLAAGSTLGAADVCPPALPAKLPPLPIESTSSPCRFGGGGGTPGGGSSKRRRLGGNGSSNGGNVGSSQGVWSRLPLKHNAPLPLGSAVVPKDMNPMNPCGTCREWLLKIAEANPNFRVITFATVGCKEIYVNRVL